MRKIEGVTMSGEEHHALIGYKMENGSTDNNFRIL